MGDTKDVTMKKSNMTEHDYTINVETRLLIGMFYIADPQSHQAVCM